MYGNKSKGESRYFCYKAKLPTAGLAIIGDQIHKMHVYRNARVAIERDRRDEVNRVMAERHPLVAQAEADRDRYKDEVSELKKLTRGRSMTRKRRGQDTDDELLQLRVAKRLLKAANATLKEERAEARKDPETQAALKLVENTAETLADEAREVAKVDGIFWPNYLAIDAAAKAFRASKFTPKFQRWSPEGKVAMQLQGGLSWTKALSGKSTLLRIKILPPSQERTVLRRPKPSDDTQAEFIAACRECAQADEGYSVAMSAVADAAKRTSHTPLAHQRAMEAALVEASTRRMAADIALVTARANVQRSVAQAAAASARPDGMVEVVIPGADPNSKRSQNKFWAHVQFRIGSTGKGGLVPIWGECIVRLHRQPPPDSEVKWAYLRRTPHGARMRWELQLVMEAPSWPKEQADAGSVGIDPGWRKLPNGDLRVAYVVGSDGYEEEFVIPQRDLASWDKANAIRGTRDRLFDAIKASLLRFLDSGVELPEWLVQRAANLDRWKSTERLSGLVAFWRDNRFDGDASMFASAWSWRDRNDHLHNYEAGMVVTAVRRRNEFYRRIAAILARRYATARIEKIDWAQLRRRPKDEESDDKKAARALARIAAPGTLMQYVRERFAEHVLLDAIDTTRSCHHCGHVDTVFDFAAKLVHTCPRCATTCDQDRNAALNLLDEDWPVGDEREAG